MFKVLIIEDEAAIRKGLINAVDWKGIGCTVCGEADSGLTGIEKYLETTPDIVITDIVMPGIDGITFLKYVRGKNPNIKVMLVTGHRDFEYAREAINLGASTLLLKPVNFDELMSSLKTLVLQLKQEKSESEDRSKDKRMEKQLQERDQFITELMKGNTFTPKLLSEQATRYGLNLARYAVATTTLDHTDSISEDTAQYQNLLHDLYIVIKEITRENFCIPVMVDQKRISIFIAFESAEIQEESEIIGFISAIQKRIQSTFHYSLSFGISLQQTELSSLSQAYRESMKALDFRFFTGENSLNCYSIISALNQETEASSYLSFDRDIADTLKNYSGLDLTKRIGKLFDNMVKVVPFDINIIKSTVISILVLTLKKVYAGDLKNFEKLLAKYDSFKSIVDSHYLYRIRDVFVSVVTDLSDYVYKKKDRNKCELIDTIREYLDSHYSRNIGLTEVADFVYFSPSYISSFIKAETGKNFVDLLNEIRIEKAKELLLRADLKSYEVGERVGINDPHYFSQVFKKVTGQTPTEYMQTMRPRLQP